MKGKRMFLIELDDTVCEFLQRCKCLDRLGRLKEAIGSLSRVLELDPLFLDAYIARGNVFFDYATLLGRRYALYAPFQLSFFFLFPPNFLSNFLFNRRSLYALGCATLDFQMKN